MFIRFGNLTVSEFAERVGAIFTEDEIATLEAHRSQTATVTDPDKFHIFDDPGISITLGADAINSVLPIFQAANDRSEFTREVGFYPAPADAVR